MPHLFFNPAPVSSIRVGFGPWCFLFTVSLAKWRSMRTRFDWWLEKTCFFRSTFLLANKNPAAHLQRLFVTHLSNSEPKTHYQEVICSEVLSYSFIIHHGRLTWNLQITHLERKMINLPNLHDYVPAVNLSGVVSRGWMCSGEISEVRNVGLNWEDLSWIVEEYNSLKAWGWNEGDEKFDDWNGNTWKGLIFVDILGCIMVFVWYIW